MPQKMTAKEAVIWLQATLKEDARVYSPGCAAEPLSLIEAWQEMPETAADLTFTGVWIPGANKTDFASLHPSTKAETFFLAPKLRGSFMGGQTAYLPSPYTDIYPWLETMPLDLAILHLSPPNKDGVCSLSCLLYTSDAADD